MPLCGLDRTLTNCPPYSTAHSCHSRSFSYGYRARWIAFTRSYINRRSASMLSLRGGRGENGLLKTHVPVQPFLFWLFADLLSYTVTTSMVLPFILYTTETFG